jgi:sarcosine oxidase subunit beta
MPSRADVIVVGGGANGTSTAYHLAARGVRSVLLLERHHLGAGATGKSGALVRMHYTNEAESRLAFESLKIFREFRNIVGGDCGFEPIGFLQMVAPGLEAALERNVARQQRLGIGTQVVSRDRVRDLLPGSRVDDIGAAAWEPDSGFADPNATTFAFAEAARRLGATIETGCEVTRVVTERGRVVGVETSRGRVDADTVVLAPGAWAAPLLKPLGLDFGLQPHRIQITIFRWPAGFDTHHCAVIDATRDSWFRPEGTAATLIGVELGVGNADPNAYDEGVDPEFVATCREALSARLPVFADATMRGGWAGMIMMSPDGRPIIDQIPSVAGLYCMLGDSGTSFKTSPAIGRCLAEWVVDGKPKTVDLTPFRSTRFAEGKPWQDADNYGLDRLTISR